MTLSWEEERKQNMQQYAESVVDENKNKTVVRQRTSFVDHKCSTCKETIPSGQPLIRETEKIINKYSDTPFYKSKYFCDEECYNQKDNPLTIREPINRRKNIELPNGFEIVNG